VVTISLIVDTLSGVILYIAPPGRVEKWIQWKVWGLTKNQWAAEECWNPGFHDAQCYRVQWFRYKTVRRLR